MAPYVASRADMVKVHDVARMKKGVNIEGGIFGGNSILFSVFSCWYIAYVTLAQSLARFTVITKIQTFHPVKKKTKKIPLLPIIEYYSLM